MRKKKQYGIEITSKTEDGRVRSIYSGYKKIRYEYDIEKRTVRVVLINDRGEKKVVEKINVESVEKYQH